MWWRLRIAFLAVSLAACAAPWPLPADEGAPPSRHIHVVSNGWHTAIVVPWSEVTATALMPEAADFAGARFLEFGWGDRDYYPARKVTLGLSLRAALTPSPAVMHLAGHAQVPEPGAGREVKRVPLTEAGLRRLIGAIAAEFERPADDRAAAIGPGLYPFSRFYPARGRFHLFNTCNTWTARMLRAAGLDISAAGVVTANDLMTRLRAATGRAAEPPA
jgi:uncharacterized protein (TIGR02117 family)